MPYVPSYSPIFGYGGGITARGGDEAGTIRRDGQAFKPYTGEIPAGFVKFGDKYEPSMSYLYARSQPQVTAQPNTMFNYASGFTPATNNVYQQATGNLLPSPTNNRFLNTGNLLGPMFSPTQQVGNYTSSYTPQSGYLTPPSMFFDRLNATNVPILNLFGTLGNAGALNNASYTNSATGFSGTVGEAQAASV